MDSGTLWRPFFANDTLPDIFSKSLRRPIARQKPETPTDSHDGSQSYAASAIPEYFNHDTTVSEVVVEELSSAMMHKRPSTPPLKKNMKKARVPGGRPAFPKQVTEDLDSDDEIIVEMKEKGYKDIEIQMRLANEGRTLYNPKTISTRWARIKKMQEAKADKLLDEELTDWHLRDEELLVEAYEQAQLQVKAEIEEVRARVWRYTAENLRAQMRTARYSAKACKERIEGIENGTARVVPELDPDPEARRLERIEKKATSEQARCEANAAAQREQNEKATKREEERIAKQQNKKAAAALKALARERQEAERTKKQVCRDAEAHAELQRRNETAARVQAERERQVREVVQDRLQKEMGRLERARRLQNRQAYKEETRTRKQLSKLAMRNGREDDNENKKASFTAEHGDSEQIDISDPRHEMNTTDIRNLLKERSLTMRGSKNEILARLTADDNARSTEELRELLAHRDLTTFGTREEMIARIAADDVRCFSRGR